ncbi:MAG: hypothetical protein A3K75_05270, partial [Euryarchaeota archaeon RBG_13_61_15]
PEAKAADAVWDGDVRAAIIFSENFTSDVLAAIAAANGDTFAVPASLQVIIDGSDPAAKGVVLGDLSQAVQIVLGAAYHVALPIQIAPTVYYGSDIDQRDFMGPGIMGVVLFFIVLIPAVMGDGPTRATKEGGCPRRDLLQRATALAVIGTLQACVMLGTFLLFPVEHEGSMLLVLFMFIMLVFASNGLGTLLSLSARGDSKNLLPVLPPILFAAIILSGMIIPVGSVPGYLQPVSYCFPLTYAIDGARAIMLRGWTAGDVVLDIAALAAYAAITYSLSYFVVARRMHGKNATEGLSEAP